MTKETNGEAIRYKDFKDFSFLNSSNFNTTMEGIKKAHLTEEQKAELQAKSEESITDALAKLNQEMRDIYSIDAKWRINMIVAMILAGMGDKKNNILPLQVSSLEGSDEINDTDADKIIRKIESLLKKRNIPTEKASHIIVELQRTLKYNTAFNTSEKGVNGQIIKYTTNRKLYDKIQKTIVPFVENRLLDFAGIVYNEVTSWMPFADDERNDIVLTPRYIVDVMVKLARVNRDSYVWDFALGSGGFLISAMNEMLRDAKNNENLLLEGFRLKEHNIKKKQLLGIEKNSEIQMLAILNMLLVGDGSSNLINKNSLTEFNGNYAHPNKDEKFPANVFLLNPPYSAEGNGMIFVKKALSMMNDGYAVIIIQDSAGSGRATEINKEILKNNTLSTSIKMPIDIFIGKSSVQTSIYVFEVGKPHNEKQIVKFIDFRNDGYARANRRSSKRKDVNLRDKDNAKGRYLELVDLVLYGASYLNIFTKEEYIEDTINPKNGDDWNFDQHKKIDTIPKLVDFKKTVADYLAWEVSNILKRQGEDVEHTKKFNAPLEEMLDNVEWGKYRVGDLFEINPTKNYRLTDKDLFKTKGNTAVVSNSSQNNGIKGYIDKKATEKGNMVTFSDTTTDESIFYQPSDFIGYSHVQGMQPTQHIDNWNFKTYSFLISAMKNAIKGKYSYGTKFNRSRASDTMVVLPKKDGDIDFKFMERFIELLEADRLRELEAYLTVTGLKNTKLTKTEQNALDIFTAYENNGQDLQWISFNLKSLFGEAQRGKRLKSADRIKGTLPFVTAGEANDGISAFIGNNVTIFPKNTITIDMFGSAKYRNYEYGADDHVAVVYTQNLPKYASLFLTTSINKVSNTSKFDYSRNFYAKDADELEISLPIFNGKPNYSFMYDLAKAIEKTVITDVISYTNKKIKTTEYLIKNK